MKMLAEFETYFSRPVAPTRRLAIGDSTLPTSPVPGFGGLLLSAVVATGAQHVNHESRLELASLITDLETGCRIVQPRLRHRLQKDSVGLLPAWHRLYDHNGRIRFSIEDSVGSPLQLALAGVYGAAMLPRSVRVGVLGAITTALAWTGELDARFIEAIVGTDRSHSVGAIHDPVAWARELLDPVHQFDDFMSDRDVQQAFRRQLLRVHPDHGGESTTAALKIQQLRDARRILLGRD